MTVMLYNGNAEVYISFFSHNEKWNKENHIVCIYICVNNYRNYKSRRDLKNSPHPTPCLQAHHSGISEDRWLSEEVFLEIAIDRDYTGSLVSLFPKRTSKLCLTVLFLSIILPYNK